MHINEDGSSFYVRSKKRHISRKDITKLIVRIFLNSVSLFFILYIYFKGWLGLPARRVLIICRQTCKRQHISFFLLCHHHCTSTLATQRTMSSGCQGRDRPPILTPLWVLLSWVLPLLSLATWRRVVARMSTSFYEVEPKALTLLWATKVVKVYRRFGL